MSAGMGQGQPQANRSIADTAILNTADPGAAGGGTYSGVDTETIAAQYENVFGPAARDIKWDTQRHKRHQRWHLPDALKGANTFLTDRVDGLITDATNSPFTKNILPYVYLENPDQKIKWNVYNFDEGIASRVPYEAAARVLPQSKRSFSGYAVRHGLALALEHNFMMSAQGRKNFQDQLLQLVGSIQMTNDIDVHMALLQAPSYQKQWDERYIDKGLTTSKICRQYIDLFGIMQKNDIALDILIEDAKTHLKTWGSQPPSFLMCNGALTRQLTMTPEKTNYVTNGPDGARRLAQGPELPSYRGLSIINTRKFSMEQGQAPRDLLRRRVRVAEHYHVPFDDASRFKTECGDVKTVQAPFSPNVEVGAGQATEEAQTMKTRFSYVESKYPRSKGPAYPNTSCELYDQSKDSMVRFTFRELMCKSLLCPDNWDNPDGQVRDFAMQFLQSFNTTRAPKLHQIYHGDLIDRNGAPNVSFVDSLNCACMMSVFFLPAVQDAYLGAVRGRFDETGDLRTRADAFINEINTLPAGAAGAEAIYISRIKAHAQQLQNLLGQNLQSWTDLFAVLMAYKELNHMYYSLQTVAKTQVVQTAFGDFDTALTNLLTEEVPLTIQQVMSNVNEDELVRDLKSYQLEADMLLVRPNIEHEMLGVIMGRGGTQELGATFWGQTEMSCYDDAQHGIWGMSYKYHERAIVTNERNLVRVFDVAFDGYNGGMNTDFVDFFSQTSKDRFTQSTYDKSSPYSGPSIIALAIPRLKAKLPNPTWFHDETAAAPNVIPEHGKRCTDLEAHMLSRINLPTANIIQTQLKDSLGITQWTQLSDNNERPGSTCIEDIAELQLMSFSGQLRLFHNDVCVEELQGAGHLGPSYVGVASVREGRGLTVQPGRPTMHRLV